MTCEMWDGMREPRSHVSLDEVSVIRSVIFDLGGTLVDWPSEAADWRAEEARGSAAVCHFLAGRVMPYRKTN